MIDFSIVKLVIFDLQQTLLNDYEAHIQAHTKILQELQRPDVESDLQEIKRLWGKRIFDVYKQLFGKALSDVQIQELVKKRDAHYINIFSNSAPIICKGAREIMQYFKDKGLLVTVSSGIRRQLLEIGLERSGLSKFVDYYVGAEDVQRGKPEPDSFLIVANHYGIQPNHSLVVGDSFLDIKAAKKGGMLAVGVTTGFTSKEYLKKSGADAVYPDLFEFLLFLNQH